MVIWKTLEKCTRMSPKVLKLQPKECGADATEGNLWHKASSHAGLEIYIGMHEKYVFWKE